MTTSMPPHTLPETVLQFGSGKFLRAFADLFIHQANQEGQSVGRVVVVQTTGAGRADLFSRQGGRYHVLVRGLANGQVIDRVEVVESVSRALAAGRQWDEVRALARSPDLRYVLSNTAEEGYKLDPADTPAAIPPHSFPAKLAVLLKERCDAGLPGVTVLPCELFEGNADLLRGILLDLARQWNWPAAFADWLETQCSWHNCLVDRIVTVPPTPPAGLEDDALLTAAEPYALWAIQVPAGPRHIFRHPAIQPTADVRPFFLRKVRILNAAHTALVAKARAKGIATVRAAVENAEIGAWLNGLLFEEIVPVLDGRVEDAAGFARQTLERFRNPFTEHQIADIAAYHAAKVQIRLVPTREEFRQRFGRTPARIEEAITAAASVG